MRAVGVIGSIVEVMKVHESDDRICEYGCAILYNMSKNEYVKRMNVFTENAFNTVLKVMVENIVKNENLCGYGFGTLYEIFDVVYGPKTLRTPGDKTISDIAKVMSGNTKSIHICKCGCKLIESATQKSGGNFRVGMEEVAKAILKAMKTHINKIEVCHNGFCALKNITSNNDDNKVREVLLGELDVITLALRNHVRSRDTCSAGLWTLRSIYFGPKNKEKAGKSGTIEAIISVLQIHTKDAEIAKVGCDSLKSITNDNTTNKDKAGELGAIETTIKVLQYHMRNAEVVKIGCDLLRNITNDNSKHMHILHFTPHKEFLSNNNRCK